MQPALDDDADSAGDAPDPDPERAEAKAEMDRLESAEPVTPDDDDTEGLMGPMLPREKLTDTEAKIDVSRSKKPSAAPSDLFSGVEDAKRSSGESGAESGSSEKSGPDPSAMKDAARRVRQKPSEDSGPGLGEELESAINDGAARLAVVGLEGDEKSDLESEFQDVFKTFRLGYFGSRVGEEYFLQNQDDVDPVWGLVGAAAVCGVFALYMRPDGEEKIATLKRKVRGLGGDDDRDPDISRNSPHRVRAESDEGDEGDDRGNGDGDQPDNRAESQQGGLL